MSEVWRATDLELGRTVAIKLLDERYARDPQLRERFRREALAAARLSGTPGIVTIFDVGETHGRPMIVMEHLPGGSLEERVRGRAPCQPGQVLEWLEQAAHALDAAHAAGVVHRDVKPGNLLLDARGHVHVADFGIASAVGLDSLTQTGTVLGTAGYLSPEQARGERAGAASDRYGLAVVGWELLAGRRPFHSDSATAEAAAHVTAPVPSIHEANPSLPPELDAVFRRALAKDPSARPASAGELVAEIRGAFDEAAGQTVWDARWPRSDTVAPRRRTRRWAIPIVLVLLAAAGVAAGLLATRGGRSAAAPTLPRPVTRTVTTPQVTRVVTTTLSAPTSTPAAPSSSATGVQLNDEGYARMQARDYAGALPLLEQAVRALTGSGRLDEAYADYNLAYTRFALGDCTDVLTLLDRAQAIEGARSEIDKLRSRASKRC
jgi:serine/threonine-protein kinase